MGAIGVPKKIDGNVLQGSETLGFTEQSVPHMLHAPIDDSDRLLVSADEVYFRRFSPSFLASAFLAGHRVHINVVDPSSVTLMIIERLINRYGLVLSVSVQESSNVAEDRRAYYAFSRIPVAQSLIRDFGCRLFVLDIDCLVRRPIEFPFADYGLFLRETEDERFCIAAGAIYVTPSGSTLLDYAVNEAALQPLAWFSDQVALTRAHRHLLAQGKHRVVRITDRLLNWDRNMQAAVWTGKGSIKDQDTTYLSLYKAFDGLLEPCMVNRLKDQEEKTPR